MAFLTAADLAAMRTQMTAMLPDTCTLLSGTLTSDGMGGGTMVWGTASAGVACKLARVVNVRNSGAVIGGQIQYESGWTLHVPYNQAIAPGQRVVVNGGTFEIESVHDIHSWNMLRNALMRQLE
jgi:hypothetical protein